MKRALSIFFPILAVPGCGRIFSRILNFLLSVMFCALLVSGGVLSFTPLVEASGRIHFVLAGAGWLVAHVHALSLKRRQSVENRAQDEQAQLLEQTELMKLAAAKRNIARNLQGESAGSPEAPSANETRSDL